MSTPTDPDLEKKTLNLRKGDFEAMNELFPKLKPSVSIRRLISSFIDKARKTAEVPDLPNDVEL